MKTFLVTGAAGFIGSAFCRMLLDQTDVRVVGVDAMTYAASPATRDSLQKHTGFSFYQTDIKDQAALAAIFQETKPDAVAHFAAETHVDRSIDDPAVFIQTNIIGTFTMLEVARQFWNALDLRAKNDFRFLHVSTDEVYGSLGHDGVFTDTTPYAPNSPYSASKAASDHLVRAWHKTYGLPTMISNCSNNYGPFQFPEKLIPNMITKALNNEKLPVYGTGDNIRDWLYVDDHAEALKTILERGTVGEKYLVGGDGEKTNLELVHELCRLLDERRPLASGKSYGDQITFVTDRPGHDKRYAMDYSKLQRELGWNPKTMLPEGLAKTVDWYLANEPWWAEIRAHSYAGERLGSTDK